MPARRAPGAPGGPAIPPKVPHKRLPLSAAIVSAALLAGGGAGSSAAAASARGAGPSSSTSAAAAAARGSDSLRSGRSGVLVTDGGVLTLESPQVARTGSSKSSDRGSPAGLDAGVLVRGSGELEMAGGSIYTSGAGAGGVSAHGSGSSASLNGTRIASSGRRAHGAMVSGGGSMRLLNVTISTAGASSAAVATDRGGGTIVAGGGRWVTSGDGSPGIHSTGTVSVSDASITALRAEGAVVEGASSITAANTAITSAAGHGVMLRRSVSAGAIEETGSYTMDGGSLTVAEGPAFRVANTNAKIVIEGGARIEARSGVLLEVDTEGSAPGDAGGGRVSVSVRGTALAGSVIADSKSSASLSLADGSALTGALGRAALALASGSRWVVAGDSQLTTLTGAIISAGTIANISGDGHTVTYDASLAENAVLGAHTYALAGGGTLRPA